MSPITEVTQGEGSDAPKRIYFPIVYKFMERRWAEEFVSGRSVRLGTLVDFRRTEKHLLNKGDSEEGGIGFADNDPHAIDNSPIIRKQIAQRGFIMSGNEFVDCKYHFFLTGPNAHVLCLTESWDPSIPDDLDSSYDCRIAIGGVLLLTQRLTLALVKSGIQCSEPSMGSVIYGSRNVGRTGELKPDCFIKDIRFSKQAEFRVAWLVDRQNEPLNVSFDPEGCQMSIVAI